MAKLGGILLEERTEKIRAATWRTQRSEIMSIKLLTATKRTGKGEKGDRCSGGKRHRQSGTETANCCRKAGRGGENYWDHLSASAPREKDAEPWFFMRKEEGTKKRGEQPSRLGRDIREEDRSIYGEGGWVLGGT